MVAAEPVGSWFVLDPGAPVVLRNATGPVGGAGITVMVPRTIGNGILDGSACDGACADFVLATAALQHQPARRQIAEVGEPVRPERFA
jgi:hypothetical protein